MKLKLERGRAFMLTLMIRVLLFSMLLFDERTLVNGCVPKISRPKPVAVWDTLNFTRKLHEPACECGNYNSTATSTSWNVFVHTTDPVSKKVMTCTGSIINSNMVVTSHKCLLLGGDNEAQMRVVDILKFKHGVKSIARAEHVAVTRTSNIEASSTPADKFEVVDIWYHPNFAISSETRAFPENDMVLIKVSTDFFQQKFSPICLPNYDARLDKTGGFEMELDGYLYDFDGNATSEGNHLNFSGGYTLMESVCSKRVKARMRKMGGESYVDTNALYKTICFEYKDDGRVKNPGGPLVISSSYLGKNKAFLLGIATSDANSQNSRATFMGWQSFFVSSVYPLIKYVEFFSNKSKSTWCHVPKLELGNGHENRPAARRHVKWPWLEWKDLARAETLDCLCGVQNTNIGGRIVGGVEAVPREFGWMAGVNIYTRGRKRGGSICGGSIINDRLILTAAHCVVRMEYINDDEKVGVEPENIDVILNAHMRTGDELAITVKVTSVIFHPEYQLARQKGYFDSDVALLLLAKPLKFASPGNKGLRPVCLSKTGEYREIIGKNAWAVGWGLTNPTDSKSVADKLQKIEIPIDESSYCANIAKSKVTENSICAGTLNQYKDAARGDSGGPLQLELKESSQWLQVGTVSWGEDVTVNGKVLTAAVYADVQKLMSFIDYYSKLVNAQWCKPIQNVTNTDDKSDKHDKPEGDNG